MSYEGDNTDYEVTEIDILIAILKEIKRLNIMISEMSEVKVIDEDIE